MSLCLSVYESICLSVCLSICLSVYLSICLFQYIHIFFQFDNGTYSILFYFTKFICLYVNIWPVDWMWYWDWSPDIRHLATKRCSVSWTFWTQFSEPQIVVRSCFLYFYEALFLSVKKIWCQIFILLVLWVLCFCDDQESLCLFVYLSVSLLVSTFLSAFLSLCLYLCLSLPFCLSFYLSVFLLIYLFAFLPPSISVPLSAFLPFSLSILLLFNSN